MNDVKTAESYKNDMHERRESCQNSNVTDRQSVEVLTSDV